MPHTPPTGDTIVSLSPIEPIPMMLPWWPWHQPPRDTQTKTLPRTPSAPGTQPRTSSKTQTSWEILSFFLLPDIQSDAGSGGRSPIARARPLGVCLRHHDMGEGWRRVGSSSCGPYFAMRRLAAILCLFSLARRQRPTRRRNPSCKSWKVSWDGGWVWAWLRDSPICICWCALLFFIMEFKALLYDERQPSDKTKFVLGDTTRAWCWSIWFQYFSF